MRYLARWEKIETDWDTLEKELSVMPYFKGIERKRDRIVVELQIPGDILPWAAFGGSVHNNTDAILAKVHMHRAIKNAPALPMYTNVYWGSSHHCGGTHEYTVFISVWIDDYCENNNKPCKILEDPQILPQMPPKAHCWRWMHEWEEILDFVRATGVNVVFCSSGVQKAIHQCKHCGKRKLMWREELCRLLSLQH